MNRFLRTDETEEAVSALEMVTEALAGVEDDSYRWKWAIIALHSAVQGFLVLALRGTAGFDVLTKEEAEAWTEAVKRGEPRPGNRLDTYLNLYKKSKGKRMLKYGHSRRFKPTGTQGASIKALNSLRNDFVHFLPKGWLLEVSGLPRMFDDCLTLIEFLGWESNNVIWYEDENEQRATQALKSARSAVAELASTHSDSP